MHIMSSERNIHTGCMGETGGLLSGGMTKILEFDLYSFTLLTSNADAFLPTMHLQKML